MKKIILISALASSFALASSTTLADNTGTSYVGGLFSHYTYDESSGSSDASPTGLTVRGGYFLTDYIAIEGRLGTGISDDTISGTSIDLELDQLMGAYAAGYLPLNNMFSLYGLIGFSYAEGSASNRLTSISFDDDGFSYGAGAQINFTPQVSGQLEYMYYLDKSDYDLTAASLGVSYNF
ncbi:porin family protein [Vreelandella profundi]|uniref:porin family protein n=1 Tax=Vreelandella profundi TaxID=2852117 RepID=UPI001F36CF27|nr:porin family protein [Halomonas profundi]